MKIVKILTLAKMAYAMILRDLLIKAIEDPKEEWDDQIIQLCDRIFNFEM